MHSYCWIDQDKWKKSIQWFIFNLKIQRQDDSIGPLLQLDSSHDNLSTYIIFLSEGGLNL